jgi:short-subunit dehydrogenase
MNKRIIPLLRSRPQRSAIINLSSCTGIYTGPYYGVYSSSKHFIDIYSRALSQEQRDKIDIISIRPFGVTTTMYRMKKNYYAITPADCAFSSLADLGKVD